MSTQHQRKTHTHVTYLQHPLHITHIYKYTKTLWNDGNCDIIDCGKETAESRLLHWMIDWVLFYLHIFHLRPALKWKNCSREVSSQQMRRLRWVIFIIYFFCKKSLFLLLFCFNLNIFRERWVNEHWFLSHSHIHCQRR